MLYPNIFCFLAQFFGSFLTSDPGIRVSGYFGAPENYLVQVRCQLDNVGRDGIQTQPLFVQLFLDPEMGYTRAEVVYSLGRRDQLDVAAIKRLVSSLSRFISPEDAQELEAQGTGIKFISSLSAGGALLLKGLWERIGIDRCLSEALKGREFTTPVGDAIFAMVANRALAPASKLAVEEWAAKDVHLDMGQCAVEATVNVCIGADIH